MNDFSKYPTVTFYQAILECKTENELKFFLHDLLSESEREKVTARWHIAQLKLHSDCSLNSLKKKKKNGFGFSQQLIERVFLDLEAKDTLVGDKGYRRVFRIFFGLPHDEKS